MNTTHTHKLRFLSLTLLSFACALPAWTAPLGLSTQPLTVGFEPPPNVAFLIDDSGSMAWGTIDKNSTDQGRFQITVGGNTCNYSYALPYSRTGTANNAPPPAASSDTNGYWLARNWLRNKIYYNPEITYTPWAGVDSANNAFADATATAARYDAFNASSTTVNLGAQQTVTLQPCGGSSTSYNMWIMRYHRWNPATADTNNNGNPDPGEPHTLVDIWNAPALAFTNEPGVNRTKRWDCAPLVNPPDPNPPQTENPSNACTVAQERQNFANWFQYYRTRMMVAKGAYSQALNENENAAFIGIRTLHNNNSNNTSGLLDVRLASEKNSLIQNIVTMHASGGTPLRSQLNTVCQFLACELSNQTSYPACPALPLAEGGACQKNFAIAMTDGYYNGAFSFGGSANFNNKDGGDGPTTWGTWDTNEYQDTGGDRLADIAMHYFENDIHVSQSGETYNNIVNDVLNKAGDVANHQHINTYTVAFGVDGSATIATATLANSTPRACEPANPAYDPAECADVCDPGSIDYAPLICPNVCDPNDASYNPAQCTELSLDKATIGVPDSGKINTWPDNNTNAGKIDDLVHAAFNGRGKSLSASDPVQLKNALKAILAEVTQETGSAAGAGSVRSSIISGGFLYQSIANPNDWSGGLLARPISTEKQTNDPYQPNHANCVVAGTPLPVGQPCPAVWDAGNTINGQGWSGSRQIITRQSDLGQAPQSGTPASGVGVKFRWSTNFITANQRDALHRNDLGIPAGNNNGQDRLQYIRGRTDLPGGYRERSSVLGDILDSGAVFVGSAAYAYDFGDYASFKNTHKNRNGIVYTGSNDGMLHAFRATDGATGNAANGQEIFGYIPSDRFIWENLNRYTSPLYKGKNHRFFVNGQTTYVDVQKGGASSGTTNGSLSGATWKSVLAGGLGNGGQTVYLLDITSVPDPYDEDTDALGTVMWEFSDLDDPDLGFTHSTPSIVRMANGRWAVIIGNGYNNSDDDTNYGTSTNSASTTGKASIFIIYVDGPDGSGVWNRNTEYFKFEVPGGSTATPNAMATPIAVDIDGDQRVDYIYAGDDLGQLWRADVTGAPSTWNETSTPPLKLFAAVNGNNIVQPISSRPEVISHPYGVSSGVVVLFGTGRYLEERIANGAKNDEDSTAYPKQSFYGIWDPLGAPASYVVPTRADLQEQKILDEVKFVSQTGNFGTTTDCSAPSLAAPCFRIVTEEPVILGDDNNLGEKEGWYLDLFNTDLGTNTNNYGERVITNPVIRGNRVVFTTMLPKDDGSPCISGGDGWLMELDMFSGGHPTEPVFDSNGDGKVDSNDKLKITLADGTTVYITPPAGIKIDEKAGLMPSPAIIVDPLTNTEKKCFPRNDGEMKCVLEAGPSDGRLSWREIH